MTTYFWSLIWLNTTFDKLPLMWNILLKTTQEFISSSEILPPIETPRIGADTFVNILQPVPHIQEIIAFNHQFQEIVAFNGQSPSRGYVNIYFLWNRASIQWGWDFMNYLKTHLERSENVLATFFLTAKALF